MKRAVGSGRLSATSGSGTWRGGAVLRHLDRAADLSTPFPDA